MTDWQLLRLGDALSVSHGFAFKGEFFCDDGDLIVLTPGNFRDEGGFKPKSGKEKYYEGPFPERFLLRKSQVVVAMTEQSKGLLGSSATIPVDNTYLHNQRIGLLEITDSCRLDLRFAYHLLNAPSVRQQIQATATGSKVRHTAPNRIEAIVAPVPSVECQRRIGRALDDIDDLIENNQRRIEILEDAVRLLYREWFVHFRFPVYEDLELVDSDLGPIPEGWEVSQVADVADLVRGRSYRRQELVEDGGLPFLNLKCIDRGGGFRKSGLKRYVGKFKEAQQTHPGDTVIAVTDMTQERNIVGQAGRVPSLDTEFGIISLDLARILPGDSVDPDFLYGMFRFSNFSETVKEHANGTNVLHLSPDRISEHRFIKPPQEVQRSYGDAVRPIFRLADNLVLQNEALSEARDLLLPRLVSGELDVSELDIGLEALGV